MGMRKFVEFTTPATIQGIKQLGELVSSFNEGKKLEYVCIEYPLDKEPQLLMRFADGD